MDNISLIFFTGARLIHYVNCEMHPCSCRNSFRKYAHEEEKYNLFLYPGILHDKDILKGLR